MLLLKLSVLLSGFLVINVYSYDVLTTIFFENLKGHPLLAQKELNDASKQFIDGQIHNYVTLVIGEAPRSKKKRSLLEDFVKNDKGIYLLSKVTPASTIPVKFPEDILFFQQNSNWFAAALESSQVKEKARDLVIFSYEKENFTEKARVSVTNAVQLSAIDFHNSTLIAVAEYDSPKTNFHNKSAIYQFDGTTLVKIQSIDMHFAKSVVFWRIHDQVYLSVAQFMSMDGGTRYEVEVPIYRWLGKHFDLVQSVPGKGARKITPFVVDNSNFLAVANFKDDKGNTQVYSEIYKYDFHSEQYRLYQRILTKACTDIQVFSLGENRHKDTFLVVANSYDQESDNYETDSIIYKFIDEYFIPFQSVRVPAIKQWLPVPTQKSLVLFGSSQFEGLKSFQYDGWSFKETLNLPSLKGQLYFVNFWNSSLVVVTKESNGKTPNVFHLEFLYEKNLHKIYHEMMSWCQRGLNQVEDLTTSKLFDVVLGKPQRADIDENEEVEENRAIEEKIDSLSPLLDKLNITTPRFINADEIVFNNIAFISDLNTTKINGVPADDILNNVIDIDNGFELDEAQINTVDVEDSISIKTINGHNASTLIHGTDNLNLDTVNIEGTLTVPEGVNIGGRLNSVVVDAQNLLLRDGDQKFAHPLVANRVKADNIFTQSVNGEVLATPQKEPAPIVDFIESLKVKHLTVGGYINDVDVPTLEKHSLKKSGDQIITAGFFFDDIEGGNLDVVGKINRRRLSDLIDTEAGSFSINQTIIFNNDLFVNDFKVLSSFDGIAVNEGILDVLLKNQTEEQEITGEKVFKEVIIYQGIVLQGRIKSRNLDKMNPVVTINDNVFLEGDKTITGGFEAEGWVLTDDVVTSGGRYSIARLEKDGLRLNATNIQPHLFFIQQLNVDDIFVDAINGHSPRNFVVLGSDETQVMEATKTFLGDLNITGNTHALNINNVDVEDWGSKVLKVEGDQVIEGKHHIKHLIADKIWSNQTKFGGNMTREWTTENVTISTDFKGQFLKTERIFVKGVINNLEFDSIVKDTVTLDHQGVIVGHKHFKNLTIGSLDVQTGVITNPIPEGIDELRLQGPVKIKDIKLGNLFFEKECNKIPRVQLGNLDLEDGTVAGDWEFDTIVINGDAFIASDKINNVSITDLSDNTVKIDEPHDFKSVIFESEVLVDGGVQLDGHIENFDFENAVLEVDSESVIFDEKVFTNLTINGTIHFNGFMNGLNMSEFCSFTMGKLDNKNLTIDGNAFFAMGPNVAHINGVSVKTIKDTAWFGDSDTTVTGSVDFQDVIFRDDLEIQGFVDNISLTLLSENYFSKSKDQSIAASFSFENHLVLENNITVPEIALNGGRVNEINLDLFVRTALLDDYDQVFENVVFLDTCFIENITGEFKVNNLELSTDVMRYDKVNMVTGTKTFQDLNVDFLKLEKNIQIQDVDVLWWVKNAVLKTTGFNITGEKSFGTAVFARGFQLGGSLNGLKFDADNIMLKDTPQEITGSKVITAKLLNPVQFKGIKLKGSLNGVDILDLVNNQAYRNQDNIFKTGLVLSNNITTTNLVVKKMYQEVNMTELIANVTNLGVLNNLLQQYEKLLGMSFKLKKSIEGQGYSLHHYKVIQTIFGVKNSRRILCPDAVTRIGSLVSDGAATRMDLYGWDDGSHQFVMNATMRFPSPPGYIDQVFMGRYLYAEDHNGFGNFFRVSKLLDGTKTVSIPTNQTVQTTSFFLPETTPCTLFVYRNSPPRVFCEFEEKIQLRHTLPLKATKAASITIKNTLYLILITHSIIGTEPHTDLWRFNTTHFHLHQSFFDAHPESITTTSYKGSHYLAIASGHVQNAMYTGRVEVRRFDETTTQFIQYQSLELDAPIQVQFAVLPSDELVLYVLTGNPTEPLLVFRHEGIAGFRLKVTGSALPQIAYANQFVGAAGQHFIVAQSNDEINVIEAVFKGERMN